MCVCVCVCVCVRECLPGLPKHLPFLRYWQKALVHAGAGLNYSVIGDRHQHRYKTHTKHRPLNVSVHTCVQTYRGGAMSNKPLKGRSASMAGLAAHL